MQNSSKVLTPNTEELYVTTKEATMNDNLQEQLARAIKMHNTASTVSLWCGAVLAFIAAAPLIAMVVCFLSGR